MNTEILLFQQNMRWLLEAQTVALAQVYATVLYYLENPETVGQYIADWLDYTLKAEAEHDQHPPAIAERLRQLRATQGTKQVAV